MQYELRGRTLEAAVHNTLSGRSCKSSNRADCERISRVRANHANNIAAILEDIGDTIKDINRAVEELDDEGREALSKTGFDILSNFVAGGAALRALRAGVAAVDRVFSGGGAIAAISNTQSIVSEYQDRISALSRWRAISHLRSSIASQRMDLARSIRMLSEANREWEQLGCGRRDLNDPRGQHQIP